MGAYLSFSPQRAYSSSSSSPDEYITQDEMDAHEDSKHRLMEEMVREQRTFDRYFNMSLESLRGQLEQNRAMIVQLQEQKLAAIERDFRNLPLLRRIYREAPDDIFELIVSKCFDGNQKGSLNFFRLVNKRCKQIIESRTTKLINESVENGPATLPRGLHQRCRRIEHILCCSQNLRSLEGCPSGLRNLHIGDCPHLSDLSPLASCSMMAVLVINNSSISDVSAVSHMLRLERFVLQKDEEMPSVKDLSPFCSCPVLKELFLGGNDHLEDLSPLSSCAALEELEINLCPCITNLSPLSSLKSLVKLHCWGINSEASLMPLVSCAGLKKVWCHDAAVDLAAVRELTRGQVKFLCSLFFTVFYAEGGEDYGEDHNIA
jgi:hypothetical protein